MKKILIYILILISNFSLAQNMNSIWCFGDSAGISFFNPLTPFPIVSSVMSRGSCASISDPTGLLLFYVFNKANINDTQTFVFNFLNDTMQNGKFLFGAYEYNQILICPKPNDSNIFYIIHNGIYASEGLYYSIVDMSINNGQGMVIQKNVPLISNIRMADCNQAIKHGNGRDWWLISKYSSDIATSFNRFYVFLISDTGISNPIVQSFGNAIDGDLQKLIFNSKGNKLMNINFLGLMTEYDFDRCTGIISNPEIIYPEQSSNYNRYFWEGAYSPNDSIFYVTSTWKTYPQDTSRLLQYNLFVPNIPASCDTLFEQRNPNIFGAIRLAADSKIYMTSGYNWGFPIYPYPDSVYNQYNMNLSVINYPDSLGAACDFQPFSFYLGGKRTYAGLPNNPNYSLGKLVGSPCDTIQYAGLTPGPSPVGEGSLLTTYISEWQKLFVNAQNIKGRNCVLKIFDMNGREVFSSSKKTQPPYFTMDVDVSNLASGLYLVTLNTEKEMLSAKFVKE